MWVLIPSFSKLMKNKRGIISTSVTSFLVPFSGGVGLEFIFPECSRQNNSNHDHLPVHEWGGWPAIMATIVRVNAYTHWFRLMCWDGTKLDRQWRQSPDYLVLINSWSHVSPHSRNRWVVSASERMQSSHIWRILPGIHRITKTPSNVHCDASKFS